MCELQLRFENEIFKDVSKYVRNVQSKKCLKCNYQTNRKSNFERHLKAMHEHRPNEEVECCGITFANKALLKEHSLTVHRDGYACKLCGRIFSRKALLRRHMSVHGGIKEFTCPMCRYETSHKSNLDRHCTKVHKIETTLSKDNPKKKRKENRRHSNGSKSDHEYAIPCSDASSETDDLCSSLEITSSQESLLKKFNHTTISDNIHDRESHIHDRESHIHLSHSSIHNVKLSSHPNMVNDQLNPFDLIRHEKAVIASLSRNFQYEKSDAETKVNCNRIRMCPQPYKCPACQRYFKSQLEFSHHQSIEYQTEDPEVLSAATVLTQFKKSSINDERCHLLVH